MPMRGLATTAAGGEPTRAVGRLGRLVGKRCRTRARLGIGPKLQTQDSWLAAPGNHEATLTVAAVMAHPVLHPYRWPRATPSPGRDGASWPAFTVDLDTARLAAPNPG
jgi:hypothetical protein